MAIEIGLLGASSWAGAPDPSRPVSSYQSRTAPRRVARPVPILGDRPPGRPGPLDDGLTGPNPAQRRERPRVRASGRSSSRRPRASRRSPGTGTSGRGGTPQASSLLGGGGHGLDGVGLVWSWAHRRPHTQPRATLPREWNRSRRSMRWPGGTGPQEPGRQPSDQHEGASTRDVDAKCHQHHRRAGLRASFVASGLRSHIIDRWRAVHATC